MLEQSQKITQHGRNTILKVYVVEVHYNQGILSLMNCSIREIVVPKHSKSKPAECQAFIFTKYHI